LTLKFCGITLDSLIAFFILTINKNSTIWVIQKDYNNGKSKPLALEVNWLPPQWRWTIRYFIC